MPKPTKNTVEADAEEILEPVVIKTENHVHKGALVQKGATIHVPAETAAWLRDNNIAEA